jgi:hypothetical protein
MNAKTQVVYWIKSLYRLNLITPETNTTGMVSIGKIDINRITLNPEMAAVKLSLIT